MPIDQLGVINEVFRAAHVVPRRQRQRGELDRRLRIDCIDELRGRQVEPETLGHIECGFEPHWNEYEILVSADGQVVGQYANGDLHGMRGIRAGEGHRNQAPQKLGHVARQELRSDLRVALQS